MDPSAIHALRSRLGETQAVFGQRFGVSQTTIGYWETGRSQPARRRLDLLAALAATPAPEVQSMPAFRPIQYLGSKQRLAETIALMVREIVPGDGRVGDLFAGSGVVSATLGAHRPVTAVDVQAYSSQLTRGLLHTPAWAFRAWSAPALTQQVRDTHAQINAQLTAMLEWESGALAAAARGNADALIELIEHGSFAANAQRKLADRPPKLFRTIRATNRSLDATRSTFPDLTATRYFGGPFFAYRQATALDAIVQVARAQERPELLQAAMAVLLSTASEIVNTVGKQFAQPIKLRKANGQVPSILLKRTLRDRSLDALEVFHTWAERWAAQVPASFNPAHRVVQGDVLEFLATDQECSGYYLDPPYTIDHYSRFYHVLETLVLRDAPALGEMRKQGMSVVMRGVYRQDRHQSAFCIPSQAPAAFDAVFKHAARRRVPVVMSYSPYDPDDASRPRLLQLPGLLALARKHYPRVQVHEVSEHSHRKLNTKTLNTPSRPDAERLIICEV